MDIEVLLQLLAVIISAFVVLKGIDEYKKAQKWKKLEFVSAEIKEFYNDPDVKRALLMLDWNANKIQLYPGEIEDRKDFIFNDKMLMGAFTTHLEKSIFTSEEVVIKNIFDGFFSKLTMFENYIQTGLILAKDIQPYIKYWINLLANAKSGRKEETLILKMWVYIDFYGYDKVRSLCYRKEFN